MNIEDICFPLFLLIPLCYRPCTPGSLPIVLLVHKYNTQEKGLKLSFMYTEAEDPHVEQIIHLCIKYL